MKNFCMLWLWVGPYPRPPPTGQRTTTRIGVCRPYIETDLVMKLSIWSNASARKSPNMTSTMTVSPLSARPAATPKIAFSLMGVDSTRCGKAVDSPWVARNAPPYGSAMSSPSTYAPASAMTRCSAVLSSSTIRG